MTEPCDIFFLDVGQGDCSFICTPSDEIVMVDCRSKEIAYHFCEDHEITHLSAIIISHFDRDHIQGMESFLTDFLANGGTIGTVFIERDRPVLREKATSLAKQLCLWREQDRLRLRPTHTEIDEPRIIASGSDWCVQILSPPFERQFQSDVNNRPESNMLSAIVQIRSYSQTITIGADAPLPAWDQIVPASLLKSHVIRAPHHGGQIVHGSKRWQTMHDFYNEVEPSIAAFSVGTNNGDKHPLPDHVRAAFRGGKCRPLCTQLTKQCHDNPAKLRAQALENMQRNAVVPPYRHDEKLNLNEVPCAGSIMVRISPDGLVETFPPANDWHDDFIKQVPRAMCRA